MSLYLGENLISGNKPINLGVRNIGEVFPALLPVTDAGAHLLDGSLILGGGIYQGFVDYIANLYNANRTLATVVVRPIAISEGYELDTNPDDTYTAVSNNSFNTGDSPHYIAYYTSTSGESSSSSSSPDEHGIIIDDPIDVPSPPSPIHLPFNTEITFNNLGIFDYTFGDVTITFQILFDQCTYTGTIPNYFCTESEWQTSVSTYGSCGKFVYDSTNNTVRLPKVSDILQGTTDVTALGDLVEAGLPNITGSFASYNRAATEATASGAFEVTSNSQRNASTSSGSGYVTTYNFNASDSNSAYGNSSTVQPQTIKVLYYIVIANSTKTEIQSDIDEIATDLNGKADTDLTNITDTGYIKMAKASMPSNRYINLTIGADSTTYTAPADGWYNFIGERIMGTAGYINFSITNGTNQMVARASIVGDYEASALILPAKKNDIVYIQYQQYVQPTSLKFFYAQGSESEAS